MVPDLRETETKIKPRGNLIMLMCMKKTVKVGAALVICAVLSGCVTTESDALYYNPGLYNHHVPTGATGIPNYDLYLIQ